MMQRIHNAIRKRYPKLYDDYEDEDGVEDELIERNQY